MDRWALERGRHGILAFSKKSGLSDSALAEYQRDETEPGAYALLKISETAGVSADYLLKGGEAPQRPTPDGITEKLLLALRALPAYAELHREQKRRYRDFLKYVGKQIRRLVFDAQEFLAELHSEARGLTFKAEEFRREHASHEDDEEDAP